MSDEKNSLAKRSMERMKLRSSMHVVSDKASFYPFNRISENVPFYLFIPVPNTVYPRAIFLLCIINRQSATTP